MVFRCSLIGVFALVFGCSNSGNKESAADSSFVFTHNVFDCQSAAPIADSEFCDMPPGSSDAVCGRANSMGAVQLTWQEPPQEGDLLSTWTHEGYSSVLMTSHYTAADYAQWEVMALQGTPLSTNYCFFSEADNAEWLATAEVLANPEMGQVVYQLTSNSSAFLSGAVVSLVDDSGQSHGEVRYQHETEDELDASLSATSASGLFVISNVEPGEYTLSVTHDTLLCTAGYSFATSVDNEVRVPVQAGAMTNGSLNCRNGD